MRLVRVVCTFAIALALTVTLPGVRAQGWGTIKGQITFGGAAIPANPVVTTVPSAEREVCCAKGGPHTDEWVVNPRNKGVRYVLVWLAPASGKDPGNKDKKIPIHPTLRSLPKTANEIDQPLCEFIPHVIAIRQDQPVLAKNGASVPHNVHWQGMAANPGGNVLIPPGKQHVIKGLKAQYLPVVVTCDIHPWMRAYIGVFNHPYFAVTDADGRFEIKDAPAGNFRLMVWHNIWGPGGKGGTKIAVPDGGTVNQNLQVAEGN